MDKTLNSMIDEMGYTTPWCVSCDHKGCKKGRRVFTKALQELVKECIPEKKDWDDDSIDEWERAGRMAQCRAIEDITKALREKGLLL